MLLAKRLGVAAALMAAAAAWPASGFAAPPILLAQAPGGSPTAGADQMIAQLRQAIRPSPSQMQQFDAVAQVMRQNAQAEANLQPPNPQGHAVDELSAQIQIGQQELAGMQRLLPPLQGLYAVLSEPQKRAADAVFRRSQQAAPR